jgi:hypothetical protein
VQQINVNGYVTFESVLSKDFVQELYGEFMDLYERHLYHRPEMVLADKHYRFDLPFRPPFNDPRVIIHPIVMQMMEAALGKTMLCHYFASNTCAPGSSYQPVHSDIFPLFPETAVKTPPYFMVLNIPLVDTTEENGAMDIWAGGTHYNTLPPKEIERMATLTPPQKAVMPAGSLMIRDGRVWHRGTQNRSNAPRPNLAIAYIRPWADTGVRRVSIPQEIYDGLPVLAQGIFKNEKIGAPLDEPPPMPARSGA